MRDQDGAALSTMRTARPSATAHHLRGRLPRPHAGDDRRRRPAEVSARASGPRSRASTRCPSAIIDAVRAAIGPQTAAILIEPIQGEGGVRVVPEEIMRELRELCDDNGLLLVLDEVQCGIGRTGRLFAHEWSGVTPDIMAIAKGIGGGFPMGACLATAEAAKGMTPGTHGTTYGGNPLAMAVGNAVLDVVLEEGFLEHVRAMGLLVKQGLASIVDDYPDVSTEMRGAGLLLGMRCVVPNTAMVARSAR